MLPVDLMTQVLSNARKITCAEVRRVRGIGVVFKDVVLDVDWNELFSSIPIH